MADCLVTKLKGAVDNPNLLKLGEFRLSGVNTVAAIGSINITSYQPTLCRVLGDNSVKFFENNQKELTIQNAALKVNTTAETDIAIEYANIAKIVAASDILFNLDDLKYCGGLIDLVCRNLSGNIKDVPTSLTLRLTISNNGALLTGDMANFKAINLKNLTLYGCVNVTIHWADLTRLTALENLYFVRTPVIGEISNVVFGSALKSIRFSQVNDAGSISAFINSNPQITSAQFNDCSNFIGNYTELTANSSMTSFNVMGTQFVGTAAQIKTKFPNASVTDKDGGTA